MLFIQVKMVNEASHLKRKYSGLHMASVPNSMLYFQRLLWEQIWTQKQWGIKQLAEHSNGIYLDG